MLSIIRKMLTLLLYAILICAVGFLINLAHASSLDAATIEHTQSQTIRTDETGGYVTVTHHQDSGERWVTIKGVFEQQEWAELEADVMAAIRGEGDAET